MRTFPSLSLSLSLLTCLAVLAAAGVARADVRWADVGPDEVAIDVIDHPNAAALLAKYREPTDDRGRGPVPAEEPLLAAAPGFRAGATWHLVTRDGLVARQARRFAVSSGAGEDHVFVLLDGIPGASGAALALGPDASPPADLRLRAPRPRALEGKAAAKALRALRGQVLAAVPKADRARARKPRFDAKTVTWVEGRFGDGVAGLVAVAAALPGPEPVDWLSALVFVDTAGRVVGTARAPGVGLERCEVLHLVDRNGDGRDEVVIESSYYEGRYVLLLEWDGKAATLTTLTGDGA